MALPFFAGSQSPSRSVADCDTGLAIIVQIGVACQPDGALGLAIECFARHSMIPGARNIAEFAV